MAGQATPTLCAWSLAAARTHARRYRLVFVRPPHQLGMRVRRSHLRAGVDRFVQPAYRYARILSAAWPYIILRHSVFECDPIRSQRCTTALTQTQQAGKSNLPPVRQFTSPWPWELTRAAATSSRGLKRGHLLTSFFTASSIFALCSPLAPHSDGIAADKERTLNVFTSLAHQTDYLGNNGRCFNRRNRGRERRRQ